MTTVLNGTTIGLTGFTPWKSPSIYKQFISENSINSKANIGTSLKRIFRPMPILQYRRNILPSGTSMNATNERTNLTISNVMDKPSGVNKSLTADCYNTGISLVTDPAIPNSFSQTGNCDKTLCNTAVINARRRTTSCGNIKKGYNQDYAQYLKNRDRSFSQNQFNYLVTGVSTAAEGSPLAISNTYRQNASGQFNVANNVVFFKPSNHKYASQGAVSASSRILRQKHVSIDDIAYKNKLIYGMNVGDYRIAGTNTGSNGVFNGTVYAFKDNYNMLEPSLVRLPT